MISIWEMETFFSEHDIVIACSCFGGFWCALHLITENPTLIISILERGNIPAVASTRNAGFACFGSVSELLNDAQMMGSDKMLQLVEMRYKGIRYIQKFFRHHKIDFDLNGGYELYDAENTLS